MGNWFEEIQTRILQMKYSPFVKRERRIHEHIDHSLHWSLSSKCIMFTRNKYIFLSSFSNIVLSQMIVVLSRIEDHKLIIHHRSLHLRIEFILYDISRMTLINLGVDVDVVLLLPRSRYGVRIKYDWSVGLCCCDVGQPLLLSGRSSIAHSRNRR